MDVAVAWIVMVSALAGLVASHQICFIGSEYNPQSGIPPRWFLPYKDPCECTVVRPGGMHLTSSSYRQGAPYYLDELFLSDDSDEIHAYFNCSRLATVSTAGIGKPTTTDTEKPTPASTEKPTPAGTEKPTPSAGNVEPTQAGTEKPTPASTEKPTPAGTEKPTTAGMEKPTTAGMEKPTTAGMEKPTPAGTEKPTPSAGNVKPTAAGTEKPTTAGTEKPTTAAECSSPVPLGMKDQTIPDDHITASTSFAANRASGGRLDNTNFWRPKSNDNSWFEVDLGQSTVVKGVITQGGSNFYTTQYIVTYREQPSSDYKRVTDGNGDIKMFVGNTDDNTPVTNLFDESVVATVVRIEPTSGGGNGIALRLELLGCPLE